MIQTWTIYIDNKPYAGREEGCGPNDPDKIKFGGSAHPIVGRRGLMSELEFICRRIERDGFNPNAITILKGDLHS